MTVEDVALAYFAAIRIRDPVRIREVFTPDAELTTMAGTVRGNDEIASWYAANAFKAGELDPRPGPFLVDGERLAVEIDLRMGDSVTRVADMFTFDGDRIARLAVYLGPAAG
jgi:hypothetical protein